MPGIKLRKKKLSGIFISNHIFYVGWTSGFDLYPLSKPSSAYMVSCFSRVQLFETPWTTVHQAPLSMGFSHQEYWNGMPCPPPGVLPDPGLEPASLMSCALTDEFFTTGATWEA